MTLAVALALTACSDGDDDTDPGTTPPPTAATTEPPATTTPVATTEPAAPTTSPAPPTTVDEETLKAQIAEDFLRAEQEREDLLRNPTLDGLEERAARIAVPGSEQYTTLVEFVTQLVDRGERAVAGEPDHSDVVVEVVELDESSADIATITFCSVTNQGIVRADGSLVPGTDDLIAIRIQQTVERTAKGWLPGPTGLTLAGARGATSCPDE